MLALVCSAQEDAGTIYLNAYMLADDGAKLEQKGQFRAALHKYDESARILDSIARNFPTWRREVVIYRRRKVNEALERCRAQVPGAEAGIARGYARTPETHTPAPGTSAASSLLATKDAEIGRLRQETEGLLARLQNTQSQLEQTRRDLSTSRTAQETLMFELANAKEKLASSENDPEVMQGLEAEIKRLTNEMAIANEALAAADQRDEALQAELQQANEIMASLQTERSELQREREQMEDLLDRAEESDVKRLLVENRKLKQELKEAHSEVKRLAADKERDAAKIASLQDRLAKVEGRLAELQQENTAYQERIASLSEKLRSTQSNLRQALAGPDQRSRMAQAALDENDTLRDIIQRQIERQAWRRQAKELVLEQIAQTGQLSRDLIDQIERLADGGAVLNEREQELLRDSLLGGLSPSDGSIVERGAGGAPRYPELLGHNDGTRTAIGLNENLTDFARAIAVDFSRGNLSACEQGYDQILAVAPNNIYAIRNLGIIKMRLGKADEAESCFHRAIGADGNDGYSHFLLGVFHYRAGDDELALESFARGLSIDAGNAKAHHYAGAICIKRGLRERARREFESVIAIDPQFGDAYYNLAFLCVTDSPPRLDLARQYYNLALKNGTPADAAMDSALGT